MPVPARVAERAATRYTVDPESGCHVSTYSVASHGYAQIGWQDDKVYMTLVHRAAWVHHTGRQIPIGQTVDHSSAAGCTSHQCVKREHLRLLENYENARRTSGRDWPEGQCANGHVDPPMITVNRKGKLRCALCHQAEVARDNAKRAAAKAAWQRRRRAERKTA